MAKRAPPIGVCIPVKLPNIGSVYDGDTLKLMPSWSDRIFTVRLMDCWAPEIRIVGDARLYTPEKQERIIEAGRAAKDRLEQLIRESSDLRFAVPFTFFADKSVFDLFTFGRILGHVWAGKNNVGDVLCKEGLAFRTKEECEAAGLC